MDDEVEGMRLKAATYFQLATLTKIPGLAEELRAKGQALHLLAALAERAQAARYKGPIN